MILKQKIRVGHYYTLKMEDKNTIIFSVLYGFEKGKNKDVYNLMIYTDKGNFEFPIKEQIFERWVKEERIKEINSDEALISSLKKQKNFNK